MHILFIQTGGTIDKDYPKTVKGYGFEITEASVKRILKKLNTAFDYEIKSVLKKDSLDITNEDRQKLTDICRKVDSDKIIITHGTDTIIETARQLSIIKNKTIILTGAFLPERFKDSDADFNIGTAVGAMGHIPLGVYIAMNGMVYRYNEVKRNIKTGKFEKTT